MFLPGSPLMTLPAILIFFLARRHLIQGITLTGIKWRRGPPLAGR